MLSWDEFDKELGDEYDNYSSSWHYNDLRSEGEAYRYNDTDAIRLAKAALDALSVSERYSDDAHGYMFEPMPLRVIRHWNETLLVSQGTYRLYDFQEIHDRFVAYCDFFNKVVLIFAAYLLSSVSCSMAARALNAKLRTPLFAYDAELSIDRHRLRTAF